MVTKWRIGVVAVIVVILGEYQQLMPRIRLPP